jgi:hypothetical protein
MAVSVPDSLTQIPGFRDRLGERVIVPQPSGALLEYLYFCDALAVTPFLEQALKDRVARLGNFSHSSYCRVRRVQRVADGETRPALVSAHVAGRRLAEILDVSARNDLKPTTAGVLAVTRQLMASVALLHDFAPYGFHGTLGPDRLILAGEGRIVVAEHVLGTFVELAVSAWGPQRLWREFRIAALPDPQAAQYGRRLDVLQVGLVTLAMLLGRPLGSTEYPDELPQLLQEATETTSDGAHVPLRAGLRGWLERALPLGSDSSFRTLLEAQKAFSQLLQDEGYGSSSVAWEAFVSVCETAAVRVPVVVVVPEPTAQVEILPVAPLPVAGVQHEEALPVEIQLAPDVSPVVAAQPEPSGPIVTLAADDDFVSKDENSVRLREDPFGPWPVDVPANSAATLLEAFKTPSAAVTGASALSALPEPPAPPAPDLWAPHPEEPAPAFKPEARSETLFETPKPAPPPPFSEPAPMPMPWEEPKSARPTAVADWRSPESGYRVLAEGEEPGDAGTEAEPEDAYERAAAERGRRIRLIILIALTIVATACALVAPYVWKVIFEGRMLQGSVLVSSEPEGAVISVDGLVRGHTPAELNLKAGEHLLELQVGGSATSRKITVKANERLTEKMTFPEAGARGGLMITTYPATGRVSIDGVPRGSAPVKITDLQPGTHTLLVETQLGAQEQDVVVQSGRVSQLAVPTASWIKVVAPYELSVYEDNRMLGTVGSSPVMIPPGAHHLEFVNKSLGLRLKQYVDAAAGQVVVVPLELPAGVMNLYADLTADVFVDGQRVGQTPLAGYSVPLGSHDVIFRHPKHGEIRYTVQVTLAAPVQLSVTFPSR